MLRILAIDLLREEPRFTTIARKWGTYLPVWVPFPVWTKLIVERGSSGVVDRRDGILALGLVRARSLAAC